MAENLSNVKIQNDEINHSPSMSNLTRGLAINGTSWSIDHDGTANFSSLKIGNETIDLNKNFDDRYIKLTGGNVSGDITTSNTIFNNNSLITKTYVDSAISTLSGDIDLSLFIPNEGNDMDDVDLELVRKSFSLESDEITLKNKTLTLATKTGNNITDKSILDDGSLQIYKFDSSNTLLVDAYISTNGFGVNRTIDDIQYRSRHEYNKLYIARDDLTNTGSIEFKVDDDQVMYIQNNKNNVVRYTYLNLDSAELYLTKGSDYFKLNTNQIYISSNTLHKYFASFLNEQDNLTKIALSGPNNYLEISPVYLKMGHASGSNAYFDVNLYDSTENLLSLEKGYEYVDGLVNYSSDMQLNIKRDTFQFIYDANRTYNNETVKYKGELLLNSGLLFNTTTSAGSNKSLFYDAGIFSVGLAHSNFSITQSRLDYSTTNNKTSLAIIEGLYDFRTFDNDYELHTHAQYDIFYLYSSKTSDNKMQYQLQLMEGNSWIKSETGNWEFGLSQYDGGLTWGGPASAIQAGKYQFALYGKGANSGNSYNIDNDGYDLVLNPGGAIISTNSGSSKTYLNLTMGTIESKSTWDGYVNGIAAHKVYASGGEFYTLAKNPGGYAYQYTNCGQGFSGIKLLTGGTLQQFSISDRGHTGSSKLTTDYETFDNISTGLQYEYYYSKDSMGTVNDDGFNIDNNYCKFLVTNGNFGYDYNYKDSSKNLTVSSIHLNPNNFNVNSSHTDNYGENFTLQAHYNQFMYNSISNTYTYGETTTRNSTHTTLLETTSTGGLHYSIGTSNYTPAGTYVNLGLIINASDIDIWAGDGNYVPKSRLYMTPTTAKITGEYNNNTYTLEWKWMQGPTLGLYASSTDGYTPVLKGFKVYDEDDNLISGSYLPLSGGIIQGTNSTDKMLIGDKSLLLERYDNNERVSYVYLASGVSRDDFVPDFTMNTTKPFTKNGTTVNYYQNQINTSGYSWNLGSEAMYIFPTGIELVSNGFNSSSASSKKYGQINLNLSGLEIQKRNANGTLTHNLKLDSGTNTAQVYLYVNDGKNKYAQFSVDGLYFGGADFVLDNLYLNSSGIGFATKEAYSRKVQYFTTAYNHMISYKNQTETGTLTFKPVTTDGEVKLTVSNTISNTTHTVTMYNGHTSTTQTSFDNNDYVTKSYVDTAMSNVDLDDYVTKEEYVELLEAYNDLTERLNEFLKNTGGIEPEPEPVVEHTFVTVPLTTVTIPMKKQNMANAFTIDWGDGTIEDTSDKPVHTQQDWQDKEFTLTHTYETEEIHYIDITPNDPDNELCTGELDTSIDLSQFTEMNLENIMVDAMFDNDTITKLSINTWLTYFGCGNVLFDGLSELNEFKLGPKSKYVECFFVSNAPKLEKITLDVTDDFHMGMNDYAGDNAFLYDGSEEDALNEIHCTSEIPFSMSNDSWFRSIDYEWNGGRVIKDNLDLTIYVPANSVNLYKYANGWNRYAPYIQAEPGTVKTRHTLVTVPTNSVSITMAQYMDNAFTIDWGDGSPIEKTGTHGTDQWNYPNEFTLTHNYSTNEIHYIDIIPNDINNELCAGTISYDTDLTQFTEMDLENIDPPNSGSDNTTITKLSMNMPKSFMGSGAPGINGYIGLNEIKYGDRFVEMVYNYISLYDNTNNPKIILGMNKDIVFYYSDQESCQYIIDCDNNSTNEIHCTSKVPFNLAGFNGEQVFLRSIDYDWVGSDAVPKQDLSDLTIYVPAESVNAYKAASSWAPYINCIQAEP